MAFLLNKTNILSYLGSHSHVLPSEGSLSLSRRGFHVEPGPREKAVSAFPLFPFFFNFSPFSHRQLIAKSIRLLDRLFLSSFGVKSRALVKMAESIFKQLVKDLRKRLRKWRRKVMTVCFEAVSFYIYSTESMISDQCFWSAISDQLAEFWPFFPFCLDVG